MFEFSEKFTVKDMAKYRRRCGVYKIGFNGTEDFYIGSSVDIGGRLCTHLSTFKTRRQTNVILVNAFNKYGRDNVYFQIFVECEPKERQAIEQFCIDELKPRYNTSKSAYGRNESKLSEEDIINIRKLYYTRNVQEDVDEIAKTYGISPNYIQKIASGAEFRDVENPDWLNDLIVKGKRSPKKDQHTGIDHYVPSFSRRKLTKEQVGMIRWAIANNKSTHQLCRILGIESSSTISRIKDNIIYKEFQDLVDASRLNLDDAQIQKLKDSDIPKIRWAHLQGIPHRQISNVFGCHYNTSCDIKMNRVYKEIKDIEPCPQLFN